jgi:hypothetical protein
MKRNFFGRNRVKVWFIKNYMSPQMKRFLPHMAEHYDFDYEFVTYKWPSWLHKQAIPPLPPPPLIDSCMSTPFVTELMCAVSPGQVKFPTFLFISRHHASHGTVCDITLEIAFAKSQNGSETMADSR